MRFPIQRTAFLVAVSACAALMGCAGQVRVPRPAGSPGAPHLGWVVMSGDRDNPDQSFVCMSDPRNDCVVPVSRPDARVFADVHFYYHPAATETKYTGSIAIGFFEGSAAANEIRANIAVKPRESPGNQSVAGIVSSRPGTYPITIAVVATSTQTGATREIRDQIRVVVR